MRIGIKFCGGCQSCYNRKKALEEIMKLVPEHDYIFAQSDSVYDSLLVISGCKIKCASTEDYNTKYGEIHLDSVDITSVVKALKAMKRKD